MVHLRGRREPQELAFQGPVTLIEETQVLFRLTPGYQILLDENMTAFIAFAWLFFAKRYALLSFHRGVRGPSFLCLKVCKVKKALS